jgi:hypothetical protein
MRTDYGMAEGDKQDGMQAADDDNGNEAVVATSLGICPYRCFCRAHCSQNRRRSEKFPTWGMSLASAEPGASDQALFGV